ncbi:hypothetical protein SUGI_1040810 [Cryptomeria japonica]|nr:hypothetical protein SUGI_1040810 [Cryptomeria japonica]
MFLPSVCSHLYGNRLAVSSAEFKLVTASVKHLGILNIQDLFLHLSEAIAANVSQDFADIDIQNVNLLRLHYRPCPIIFIEC